jgi:hypothetical protein
VERFIEEPAKEMVLKYSKRISKGSAGTIGRYPLTI